MYAIVDICGQQFKVEKDAKVFCHRLNQDIDSEIIFDKVLFIDNQGSITVGMPFVENAKIKAKVLEHLKGDKVLVFKKKRRKGYQKLNGHRQYLSKVLIEEIIA
ncbi:MAG: 50S ribosomal protein L21 [Bacteroidales bacterium]|nr:50S ribosomal protein L21 [Bacteroidales bacterium]